MSYLSWAELDLTWKILSWDSWWAQLTKFTTLPWTNRSRCRLWSGKRRLLVCRARRRALHWRGWWTACPSKCRARAHSGSESPRPVLEHSRPWRCSARQKLWSRWTFSAATILSMGSKFRFELEFEVRIEIESSKLTVKLSNSSVNNFCILAASIDDAHFRNILRTRFSHSSKITWISFYDLLFFQCEKNGNFIL